jgi:hypothetical protein
MSNKENMGVLEGKIGQLHDESRSPKILNS